MSFAFVVLGLILLVVIHELGHFVAARMVGIRATKFYVFFPPAIFKRKVGDVEYGIGAIPAGGFVKLPGMFEPRGADMHWRFERELEQLVPAIEDGDLRLRAAAAHRALAEAPNADVVGSNLRELRDVLQQVLDTQRRTLGAFATVTLEQFQRRVRRSIERLSGAIDDCDPKAYWRAALWRRMVVIVAGPLANVLLAFAVVWVFMMVAAPRYGVSWSVAHVEQGKPASRAGIRPGDQIVRWNDRAPQQVSSRQLGTINRAIDGFVTQIKSTRGQAIHLVVRRGNRTIERTIQPTDIGGTRRIGLTPTPDIRQNGSVRNGPVAAASMTTRLLGGTVRAQVQGIARLATGQGRKDVTSVVGIVKSAPQIQKQGSLILFLAIMSLVIAVMNLLPLLPLDGGHLAFGFVEALRHGRPLPREAFERMSFVGLAIVLGLFMIGLQNDLGLRG